MNSWDAFWIGAVAGSLALAIIGRQWRAEQRIAQSADSDEGLTSALIQRASIGRGKRQLTVHPRFYRNVRVVDFVSKEASHGA